MTPWPTPTLRHVARLTDHVGVVEHARHAVPRRDLGYCTDDAGRALALAVALSDDPDARRVATVSLRFLTRAFAGTGRFSLRLGPDDRWTADAPSDDAAGRALFGLGAAVARAPWADVRAGALALFESAAASFRSPHPRANASAALGALDVLTTIGGHPQARRVVAEVAPLVAAPSLEERWLWPEARLTYANALLPEAALAVATATGDHDAAGDALTRLAWLVDQETADGRFSFTPVGGRGPLSAKPAFDQQPIEAWAMVDACARAHDVTGDPSWADVAERAARWFLGDNDAGVAVYDPITGGGFDGLEPDGVNRNRGAESTLAVVASLTRVQTLRRSGRPLVGGFA